MDKKYNASVAESVGKLSRRRVLSGVAGVGSVTIAGCSGDEPVDDGSDTGVDNGEDHGEDDEADIDEDDGEGNGDEEPDEPVTIHDGPDDFYGMLVGNDTTNLAEAERVMNDLGVNWVRLWADVDYRDKEWHPTFDLALELSVRGFNVVQLLSSHHYTSGDDGIRSTDEPVKYTYDEVKEYCDWLQEQPSLVGAVDIWEIENEPNLPNYWNWSASHYVDVHLKAAYESFSPNGHEVMGCSPTTWQVEGVDQDYEIGQADDDPDANFSRNTSFTEALVESGYLEYCDYAGTHPYANDVQSVADHFRGVDELYGDKPIIITEWNINQRDNHREWANALSDIRAFLHDRVETACYYRLIGFDSEGGWPGIVEDTGERYAPANPFYQTYAGWPKERVVFEATLVESETDGGNLEVVEEGDRSFLRFQPEASGDRLIFDLEAPVSETYSVHTIHNREGSTGEFRVDVGDETLDEDDFSGTDWYQAAHRHGTVDLEEGEFEIAFEALSDEPIEIDRIEIAASEPDPDLEPPKSPATITANPTAFHRIELEWSETEASDGSDVTYSLRRNGDEIARLSGTSYIDDGLQEETEYSYYVIAEDHQDNESDPTDEVTVQTLRGGYFIEATHGPSAASLPDAEHRVVDSDQAESGGGGYVIWIEVGDDGEYLEFTTEIDEPGSYEIEIGMRKSSNQGKCQLEIDGDPWGDEFDLYAANTEWRTYELSTREFDTGESRFRFVSTGINADSSFQAIVVDYIKLRRVE